MSDTAPMRRSPGCAGQRRARLARLVMVGAAAALAALPSMPAPAQTSRAPVQQPVVQTPLLRVADVGCKDGVQVTSKGATLSQVLQRMSQTLHFELQYWSQEDPVLNMDVRSQPIEVMALLSAQANLIVRYAPDRRCARRWCIASLWVLPGGEVRAGNYRAERPSLPVSPAAAPLFADPITNSRSGVDDYLRAHGLMPVGPAASAAEGG